jgi:uncharacterized RDD family membrane protein YckC
LAPPECIYPKKEGQMHKETDILIETPEKIQFSYHIAEIGTRIAACVIDEIIQGMLIVLFILPLLLGRQFFLKHFFDNITHLTAAFLMIMFFLIRWFYYVLFEIIMEGQSPGKKLMRIRVIRFNGDALDIETIILRNFIRIVDNFPIVPLVGGFVALIDSYNRRLGDLVANTLVVNEIHYDLRVPDFQVHFTRRAAPPVAYATTQAPLTENELYIIRRFLNDYDRLPEAKQREIAANLANEVQKRLGIAEPITDSFLFLERIYQQHGK